MNKIEVFLREQAYNLMIPAREDLFEYQIHLLDSNYDLVEAWNLFNEQLDQDFGGNLEKYNRAKVQYSSDLIDFYAKSKVSEKVKTFIKSKNLEYTNISEDLLPGHTYLKIDLDHAYNQALEYFSIISTPEEEFRKGFAKTEYIYNNKALRLASYACLDINDFKCLTEHLLSVAVRQNEQPFRQLQLMGIPVVRKDIDDLVYDITNFEDTFSSFIGPLNIDGIHLKVSMFRQESTIFYYDYGLHIVNGKRDLTTGKKKFGYRDANFIPQLTKLENNLPMSEKDLWWQDSSGLYRFDKPIRQVILGPETVLE